MSSSSWLDYENIMVFFYAYCIWVVFNTFATYCPVIWSLYRKWADRRRRNKLAKKWWQYGRYAPMQPVHLTAKKLRMDISPEAAECFRCIDKFEMPDLKEGAVQTGNVSFSFEPGDGSISRLVVDDQPPGTEAVCPQWLKDQGAGDFIKKDLSERIDNFIDKHPGTSHCVSGPPNLFGTRAPVEKPKVEIFDADTLVVKYRCEPEDRNFMLACLPKMGDKHPTLDARVANSNGHRSCCVWVYYQEGNYVMLPDMRVVWQSR